MGIYKLLSFIRNYLKLTNIKEYEYQNCGIDGHFYLRLFLPRLGIKILEEEPDLTPVYRKFLSHLKKLKKEYHIDPFVILEGNDTPIRKELKNERIREREEKLKKVQELISENNFDAAKKIKSKAMNIKPYHCKQFYDLCIENGIKCMISPYEVDHQLKYLEKTNKIDFIIGNDTDLIALNCKNVLFRFNFKTLEGLKYNKSECEKIFFENNFNEDRLLLQCILRGCYYYKGINENNFNITLDILNQNDKSSYIEIIKKLLSDKSNSEIEENIKEYEKAYISYKYGIIYDPYEKKEKYLNELPINKNDFVYKYNFEDIVGKLLDQEIIDGLVIGKINPKNLEEIKNIPKPTSSFMRNYDKLNHNNNNYNNNDNNYNNHYYFHNKKYDDKKKFDKKKNINYHFFNNEEIPSDSDSSNKSEDKNYNLNFNFNFNFNKNLDSTDDIEYYNDSKYNSNYNKEKKNSILKVNNNYNNNNYQEERKYYNKNDYQNKIKYNNDDNYRNKNKYKYNNNDFLKSKIKNYNNINTYHKSNIYYPKKNKNKFKSNDINNYENLFQNPIYFNK